MSKKIALSVDYFFIVVDYIGTFSEGEMPVNGLTTLELGYLTAIEKNHKQRETLE